MQDEDAIRRCVRELCDPIQMRRFGDELRVSGFSLTHLIETSLVSAHFTDHSHAIDLDVFSGAPYEPNQAADFAARYFKAGGCKVQVLRRN